MKVLHQVVHTSIINRISCVSLIFSYTSKMSTHGGFPLGQASTGGLEAAGITAQGGESALCDPSCVSKHAFFISFVTTRSEP